MERQEVMIEVLKQAPVRRKKKQAQQLTCGICSYFPLKGKCEKAGWKVKAEDTCCIFFKKGTGKP